MTMIPLWASVPLIPLGLVLTGWGLWVSHRDGAPRALRALGALAAPAGVALSLLGTLLVCVPGFFSG